MPNWCENVVEVSGPESEMNRFREWLDDGSRLLSRIAPLAEDNDSPVPDEWGTKWDVEADVDDSLPCDVTLVFDSAWSPPIPAIERLATVLFPSLDVEHSYNEPGMDFSGVMDWEKGVLVKDEEGPGLWSCDACGEPQSHARMVTFDREFVCIRCYVRHSSLMRPIRVLVCAPRSETLTAIEADLSTHPTVNSLLGDSSARDLVLRSISALSDEEFADYENDEVVDADIPPDHPMHALPFAVERSEGGSLVVTLTTLPLVLEDNAYWADYSTQYPDATFYVTADTHTVAVARGDVLG